MNKIAEEWEHEEVVEKMGTESKVKVPLARQMIARTYHCQNHACLHLHSSSLSKANCAKNALTWAVCAIAVAGTSA